MKLKNFSKSYSMFISKASKDEIIYISKELSNELAEQSNDLRRNSLWVLTVSIIALIASSIIIILNGTVSGQYLNLTTIMKLVSLLFMCVAIALACMSVEASITASSMSPLIWRKIRENVDDAKANEQIEAIRLLNKKVYTGRNLMSFSVYCISLGAIVMALVLIVSLMVSAGYI